MAWLFAITTADAAAAAAVRGTLGRSSHSLLTRRGCKSAQPIFCTRLELSDGNGVVIEFYHLFCTIYIYFYLVCFSEWCKIPRYFSTAEIYIYIQYICTHSIYYI